MSNGCNSTQKVGEAQDPQTTNPMPDNRALSMEQLAEVKFGQPYSIAYNESKSHGLVIKKMRTRPNDAYPTLRFFVYDLDASQVVYENTEPGGTVTWKSDSAIEVSSAIGIPNSEKDRPKTYYYDIVTKKKYSGGFMNNKPSE